ncbi:MAG: TSCPD domain-containing protein [Clostridiales bacterium]|nr:TSCPD domain-containing protein [Clostridiales bacterium]
MKHVTFAPKGICAQQIDFDIDDDGKLHNVAYVGGCKDRLNMKHLITYSGLMLIIRLTLSFTNG